MVVSRGDQVGVDAERFWCDAAAFDMAAKYGLPNVRRTSNSAAPSPAGSAGPIAAANDAMVSTGRAPLPAMAEPNQSTSKSSALRITGCGMSSYRSPAAKAASS